VLSLLTTTESNGARRYELATNDGRERAYDAILTAFTRKYGNSILSNPAGDSSWLVPTLGLIGALCLLFALGRRVLARHSSRRPTAAPLAADAEYSATLDRELERD
jgi:predicted mannosyl-3-phosphoglycerate phosphatase (HAD superfamily)